MTIDLPVWARDILSSPPRRGEGLNPWLMRASVALRRSGRSEAETIEELRCLTAGEPVKPGEIERAARRSAEYVNNDGAAYRPPAPKWPAVDKAARAAVIAEHDGGAVELWERSPARFDDDSSHTEEIVDRLFPGNPLICVADGPESAVTGPRESFRGRLGGKGLIVPSPMTKLTGINQDGEEAVRCLDNTGPRRFLIVEQDSGTQDEQAAVIFHLANQAPLLLVVHSGGKSLHSWFACGSQPESVLRRFFNHAVSLGADHALWTRCQLCRMPDGTRRKDGKTVRQAVLYWNPGNTEPAA